MSRILKVTRLHLNKLGTYTSVPPIILAFVLVVTVIIQIAILRGTGADPTSPDYVEGARWNQAILWALPGFLVYYGVQAVATTYPFALALGTTRRNFILGTMLANALQALYVTALLLVLLGLELLTNHWFLGVYAIDVYLLGAGDPAIVGATAFLGTLFCLTIGGLFAAVWVRFGSRGPALMGIVLGLGLSVTLLIIAPDLGEIFLSLTRGGVAIGAIAVMVVALVGTWFAMRRASVR